MSEDGCEECVHAKVCFAWKVVQRWDRGHDIALKEMCKLFKAER